MEGRQPEDKNDLNDDDIIDLKNVVQSGSDDGIIDLTEVLDQPDLAPAAADSDDEDIIPLVDPVSTETAGDETQAIDDDIIELTDMAAEPDAPPADETAAVITPDSDDDEEVIDLMDIAQTLESEISEADVSVPVNRSASAVDEDATGDEEIIDLMEVAQPQEADSIPADESTQEAAPGTDADTAGEAIIDLTDVAAVEAPTAADAETVDEADDEPIDLLDVATMETAQPQDSAMEPVEDEPVSDLEETVSPTADETGATDDLDDDFSDLESRADVMLRDTTYRFDYDPEIEAAETAGPDADFSLFDAEPDDAQPTEPSDEPIDVDEPTTGPTFVPIVPSEASATDKGIVLTEQQLEAALTQVVEKIYGEKIEQLMLQTIEKTVRQEIAKIKNALLEEGDDMTG